MADHDVLGRRLVACQFDRQVCSNEIEFA